MPNSRDKKFIIKKKIFVESQLIFIPDPILNVKKINIMKREKLEKKFIEPFFLAVGRFTKQKNHIFLLNFFSKNSHYLEDNKLIIIGQGELKESYDKVIRQNNLENKVEILNYKKNIFNYIFNAKCVISSSLWEDPGFVMVESAYIGTPIISSDCPSGPKEFIGRNERGYIYNLNDENSFKLALDNFILSSKNSIDLKLINAKKKSKIYTCFYNSKKLSEVLKN